MLVTFLQNVIVLLSAASGALIAVWVGVSHQHLCALISFAAGTLFATTFLHIIPETLSVLPLLALGIAFSSGYGAFFVISRYIFHVCPACSASHFDEHAADEFRSMAVLLAIALGLHSTMDGIAIAVGRELGDKADLSIWITITIHKLPEGLALCALLLRAGYGKTKSILLTLGLESSTLLGWVLGALLLTGFEESKWFYGLMVHIGGGFIYLALHAVLNESRKHSPRFILFFFLVGVALISLTRWIPF